MPQRADPEPLLRARQAGGRRSREHRAHAGSVQRGPRRPGGVGELRGPGTDADLQRVRAAVLDLDARSSATAIRLWRTSIRGPVRGRQLLDLRGRACRGH